MRKISVIIPCYNVAAYIDRCMTSITVQTIGIESLEIICIDDASTDATWEHLQKWERMFPENVLLIQQEVNQRQGAARNLGLQYASAKWIAFVDADDWLEMDYFELLYAPVERYVCDVVVCEWGMDHSGSLAYFEDRDREDSREPYFLTNMQEQKKIVLIQKPLGETVWAKIIRKDLLLAHQIFFPEGITYEDNYWVPLLHLYTDRAYVIKKRMYHYFINSQSTVRQRNADYHIDWITLQMLKWKEYRERGLWEEYHDELECDLLYNAVCFMKTLVLRFEQPPFSYYQLERQLIRQWIPDYKKNPYASVFQKITGLLLEALYLPMNRNAFLEFAETAKRYYASQEGVQAQSERSVQTQGLRIVMFYSETESFNFFTDQLKKELEKRGHEVFICDLEDVKDETEHSYSNLNRFILKKVDAVICFDGLGTREDQFIEQWDKHQAVVIDILMDPPFRFHPTLEKHSKRYRLFCCDLEHVAYVKKYFSKEVSAVAFMPHVGVLQEGSPSVPYAKRSYDILFSGSYVRPESYLQKIPTLFPDDPQICSLYQQIYDTLLKDSHLTIEAAVTGMLAKLGISVSESMLKTLLNRSLYVDWAIRMYHRGRVVETLAESGLELYLLGQGWEEHTALRRKNVHRIEGQVPYARTLPTWRTRGLT